ncbi:MAG: hypothetical protein GY774_21675 [Planctomycetes bacterium]|nr:hypothetical protein [Planctomycetota bacterium]
MQIWSQLGNDKWALLGTVGWEDWSTMDSLLISTESGSVSLPRNWHDTWYYAGGIRICRFGRCKDKQAIVQRGI